VIVCGLPGAGKTTHARLLARSYPGVRLCPDDWLVELGFEIWDADARRRVEALQLTVATEVLVAGGTAIVEWGTWARVERDTLRSEARRLGARVELHVLDPPLGELWERVRSRGLEDPPITLEQLAEWHSMFERPTADELAGYDPPLEGAQSAPLR
jgi:predicted kinase